MGLVGILFCVTTYGFYAAKGYHTTLLALWLTGLACIALSLYQKADATVIRSISWSEILCPLALLVLFSPVYLAFLNEIPVQVNSDEIAIGNAARNFTAPSMPDLFAPSSYFDFPAFIFILFGWIAKALGGITFTHMRLVHALFGLSIVVPAYFFFRLLLSQFHAGLATAAVLSNHALIAVSRMVSRNNVALLNELAAFAFLLLGLQRRSRFYIFIGGAIAGLSFYHYPPSRLIFFIWTGAYICMVLFSKTGLRRGPAAKLFLFSLFGFLAVISPMLIASVTTIHNGNTYGRKQVLLFPEGRQLQASWYGVSQREGVFRNIRQGLVMFNAPLADQANIYTNAGHGFTDPTTGILLWIGVLLTLARLRSKQRQSIDVFFLTGFVMLWATYLFIFGQAPNYTRLYLIIPFIAFFTLRALLWFTDLAGRGIQAALRTEIPLLQPSLLAASIVWIVTANLCIFSDFVRKGLKEGNDVGSTGRYIEARQTLRGYAFYIAADSSHPYYGWETESAWRDWASFFKSENQLVDTISPAALGTPLTRRPLTIFMSNQVWQEQKAALIFLYPQCKITHIKTDGSLIALEVI